MILHTPHAVFVPFELTLQGWIKRDDLPRFLEPSEVKAYLLTHPKISYRHGVPVPLQWREHSERDLIAEYVAGVGTPEFLRRRH